MNKIQIPERTFYHCNRVLAKQIEEFKSKLSEEGLALAEEILEQRLTHYLISVEKKLDKKILLQNRS
jgi:hypothetical protein